VVVGDDDALEADLLNLPRQLDGTRMAARRVLGSVTV